MSVSDAMRRCWVIWGLMVVICSGAVGSMLIFGPTRQTVDLGVAWYVVTGTVYTVLIPLSGVMHWRFFRRYWKDGVVQPEGYVKAFLALWVGLTLSVLAISALSLIRQALLPDLVLVLPPTLMLMGTWPTGWAMTDRVDSLEDEAVLEEDELLHVHSQT